MKVVSIKEVEPRKVYAISTSTGTFVADGLAHHNCVGCNMFGGGKPLDFEEKLKRELGEKVVEEMKHSRHEILKVDRQWYEERIAFYENEIKNYD